MIKLFCFAHAGGTAASFSPLVNNINGCALVPIERPGHGSRWREPLMSSIQEYAGDAVDQIANQLDGPFCLMGHSMGAWLAYEVAVRLRMMALPDPLVLVVSGNIPPRAEVATNSTEELDDEEFIRSVISYAEIPVEILRRPDLRDIFFVPLRADFEAVDRYSRPQMVVLECPVIALFGKDDPLTLHETRDWSSLTSGPYEERIFCGGHFFLYEQIEVAETLAQDLLSVI